MCKLKPIIEFKAQKLAIEFMSNNLDSRLNVIIMALAGYVYFNFGKSLMITEIYRTQEMQDAYYANDPKYKIKPWQSVHQYWRGVDISLRDFLEHEIKAIETFLNKNFIYTSNKNIMTAKIHDIGWGWHLHLQVDPDNITSIVKWKVNV